MSTFIVKVQQSLSSSDGQKHVLLYNKDRSIMYDCSGQEAEPVVALLGKSPKEYFTARMNGTKVELIEKTKAQSW